ncbi:MAG: hypothetical protein KJ607_00055, partial [Bacteroidetes bacterium]|nr:hypothetical protein [Bacteroidota bacterium]
MEIILTTIYTLAFLLLIYRMKFFRIEGVSRVALAVFFVIKVFCGIALIFIYSYYYTERTSSDIYNYFDDGNRIYSAIDDNPADYLRMLTGIESDAPHLMKYYSKTNYWFKDYNYELFNDNRTIIRYNAFVRLFSFGYIEIHTVVMAFLSFAGLCGILKVFLPFLKNKNHLLVFAVFAFPSVMFWSSGVLKEGLVIFSSGLFVYAFHRIINRFSWKYLAVV